MKIAVVGGGISGLSVAFWIEKVAKEKGVECEIELFEKEDRLGGTINTHIQNGFVIESGPNGFLDSKPHTLKLFSDAGLYNNLLPSNDKARKRYILKNNRLVKLPESPAEFFKTELLSFTGKLRVISEFFIPAKRDDSDETVAQFAIRRLGKEACDYLISPMVAGVFAGDAEKLSLKSSFPIIYELERGYGGLFKALLKKRNKKSGPAGPGGKLTSYRGGLVKGIDDISSRLEKTKINLACSVKKVERGEKGYLLFSDQGERFFDKVVFCIPAYILGDILKSVDEEFHDLLKRVVYAPMFVVGFGFKNSDVGDPLDGFGYLIPPVEKRRILGSLFTSSIFPERAPEGFKLIRVMLGGDRNRWILDKNEDELVEIALEEIADTLKIKGEPVYYKTFYWQKAIPQYYQGHSDLVNRLENLCATHKGLYIGGNILYGIGINDCTKTSFEIVQRIFSNN